MTCAFDLAHYGELLDAARSGGYRYAFFDGDPKAGDLLLRHDVDLSLDAAVRLDGDRRGYVIAVGRTSTEALERAEAAARLLEVEVEAT